MVEDGEIILVGGFVLGVGNALEGIFHVLGAHFAVTTRPLQAGLEAEFDMRVVDLFD